MASKQITLNLLLCCCCCFVLIMFQMSSGALDVDKGTDTLLQSQVLRNGEYLNSANKMFRLQFFSPATGTGLSWDTKYLGVFHNTIRQGRIEQSPVWVANRNTPVPDLFVELKIDPTNGELKIYYHGGSTMVSNFLNTSLSSTARIMNTSATILDNGNFVLRAVHVDGSTVLWQSFDYPTDTLLPGMKLGFNFGTGQTWSLASWISAQVPAPGSFILGGNPNGSEQLVVFWLRNVYWTTGVWDNDNFNATYSIFYPRMINMTYISNEREKYFIYSGLNNDSFAKIVMDLDGMLVLYKELRNAGQIPGVTLVVRPCSNFSNYPYSCVTGALPKCRGKLANAKFRQRLVFVNDDSRHYHLRIQNMSLFDCEVKCRQNCSCIAYASLYSNMTGCEIFDNSMVFGSPQSISSGLIPFTTTDDRFHRVVYFLDADQANKLWGKGVVTGIGGTLVLLIILCCVIMWKKFKGLFFTIEKSNAEEILLRELEDTSERAQQLNGMNDEIDRQMKMNHVHVFSFAVLEMATNNFSITNKLGEGGFGSVYKGELIGGQEIAIKRLSRTSRQGLLEFKNELLLIAKLQHDNLVKLLGCCTKGQEKMLVYEYMPNKSLDLFLFDDCKREVLIGLVLKWNDRKNIIEGIAQGLLYLHRFSRFRVIHRDLKASNILLDRNMNPKISDFGMARIFGKQESEANTNRVVGTYGYMPPEYAMKGIFSIKTDVFSFGVLLLEIVSGNKNNRDYDSSRTLNLIGFAWELWVEGKVMKLIDPTLDVSSHENDIVRCVNVGLLCVQEEANDRPTMTQVTSMLTNESLEFQLPYPKQPAFLREVTTPRQPHNQLMPFQNPCTNALTISDIQPR